MALFRAGHDEAFRAIHERYHKRLMAYARQMLPRRQDAEDALQDVFVRAYSGLRASDRELALRAWLFRVAHNRCVDELRRPDPPPPELLQLMRAPVPDPLAEVDMRESLRRLIEDVRRLPDQQRSALLMREFAGMSYGDLACSLGISIPAVKSLLVRARISLARAAEARDTACSAIREELIGADDRGVRPNANARRHMRDCTGCRSFRRELRGVTRQLAALAPAVGPLGFAAKVLGFSGGAGGGATAGGATAGGATAGGATAGGGAIAAGGGGAVASAGGLVLGANHVATLIAAAVATAGGAVEIQHTITTPPHRPAHVRGVASRAHPSVAASAVAQAIAASDTDYASARTHSNARAVQADTPAAIKRGLTATPAGLKHKLRHAVAPGGGGASVAPAGTDQSAAGGGTVTATGSATGTGLCGAGTTSVPATTTKTAATATKTAPAPTITTTTTTSGETSGGCTSTAAGGSSGTTSSGTTASSSGSPDGSTSGSSTTSGSLSTTGTGSSGASGTGDSSTGSSGSGSSSPGTSTGGTGTSSSGSSSTSGSSGTGSTS